MSQREAHLISLSWYIYICVTKFIINHAKNLIMQRTYKRKRDKYLKSDIICKHDVFLRVYFLSTTQFDAGVASNQFRVVIIPFLVFMFDTATQNSHIWKGGLPEKLKCKYNYITILISKYWKEPFWFNFKTNNSSIITINILVIHDSETKVIIDEIFVL